MGSFPGAPACLSLVALLVALVGCQGRYGRNGLALFPEGSAPRSFFGDGKCTFNDYKDTPTWFCNLALIGGFHRFGLIESKQTVSHSDGIKAFLDYDEGKSGVSKGEVSAKLQGELAGMEVSAVGLEQTYNGAVLGTVVFVGTQGMPDGTGITVWCSVNADMIMMPQGVEHCHTGMKLLRDKMVELHAK